MKDDLINCIDPACYCCKQNGRVWKNVWLTDNGEPQRHWRSTVTNTDYWPKDEPYPDPDLINKPSHYTLPRAASDCFSVMQQIGMLDDHCLSVVFQYIWRAKLKKQYISDLKKARWFLDKAIERYESKHPEERSAVSHTSKDGRPYAKININCNWVIPGDVHLPFHDPQAIKFVWNHNYSSGEAGLFITGDLVDLYWLSSWPKSGDKAKATGYQATRKSLLEFVSCVSNNYDHVVYGCGNHEDRVASLTRKFPGFDGEWYWMFKDILPTTWHYLPHGYRAELPQKTGNGLPILVEHGDKTLYGGVPSADKLATSYPGQCTIIGHNHRLQQSLKTTWRKGKATTSMAYTCGHMSDIVKNNYAANPNWQQGYTTVSVDGQIQNHLIVNGCEV
jgi:hypothetical protein